MDSWPVWIQGYKSSNSESVWYCVNVEENDLEKQIEFRRSLNPQHSLEHQVVPVTLPYGMLGLVIQPSSICATTNYSGCKCVAMGSYIICTCGFDSCPPSPAEVTRRFCFLDTTNVSLGWKFIVMNRKKNLVLAVLDNEFYISANPMKGEIINFQTGEMKSMAPMPSKFMRSLVFLTVFPERKLIVFCSCDLAVFVFYDINRNDWYSTFDPIFQLFLIMMGKNSVLRSTCAVVHTTIYWFCCHIQVFAYDFVNHKMYRSELVGDFHKQGNLEEDRILEPSSLLHLTGDIFCLVWQDHVPHKVSNLNQIRCTKLRFEKQEKLSDMNLAFLPLEVSVIFTQTYLVDQSFLMSDALLVNSRIENTIGGNAGEGSSNQTN